VRIGRTRLIVALTLGLFVCSPSAHAQQLKKIPLIGILSDVTPVLAAKLYEPPFAGGLQELGWIVNQNIAFEKRYAEGKSEILPGLATELVRLQPDVILAIGIKAAVAAKSATQTIPVVFVRTADPIGSGLVLSLARPGGNLTGLSDQMVETSAKRLELLVTAAPDAKRVGVLWNSDYPPSGPELVEIERAPHSLEREIVPVDVRGPEGLEPALRAMAEQRVAP
jgi:putative tryptophan/tyrosine transport system substrate-binding protein